MSGLTILFVGIAACVSLAAIFFLIKNYGKVTYQQQELKKEISAIEESNKQAKNDKKDISAMSDDDKRDELSK